MTYQETAELLDEMLNYWPNMMRNNDIKSMVRAWSVSLKDISLDDAKRACVVLSENQHFPPNIADIMETVKKNTSQKSESFNVLFSRSCKECLGFETPVYMAIQQGKVQAPERLKLI